MSPLDTRCEGVVGGHDDRPARAVPGAATAQLRHDRRPPARPPGSSRTRRAGRAGWPTAVSLSARPPRRPRPAVPACGRGDLITRRRVDELGDGARRRAATSSGRIQRRSSRPAPSRSRPRRRRRGARHRPSSAIGGARVEAVHPVELDQPMPATTPTSGPPAVRRADQVAQHRPGLDAGQLVGVADQHEAGLGPARASSRRAMSGSDDHRGLVDDHHVVGQRVVGGRGGSRRARRSPATGARSRPRRRAGGRGPRRRRRPGRPARRSPRSSGRRPCRWERPDGSPAVRPRCARELLEDGQQAGDGAGLAGAGPAGDDGEAVSDGGLGGVRWRSGRAVVGRAEQPVEHAAAWASAWVAGSTADPRSRTARASAARSASTGRGRGAHHRGRAGWRPPRRAPPPRRRAATPARADRSPCAPAGWRRPGPTTWRVGQASSPARSDSARSTTTVSATVARSTHT